MNAEGSVRIDVEGLYRTHGQTALFEHCVQYEREALALAGAGRRVILSGRGPIWLYLRLAHALHGVARSLVYVSGQGDEIQIFDHTSTEIQRP